MSRHTGKNEDDLSRKDLDVEIVEEEGSKHEESGDRAAEQRDSQTKSKTNPDEVPNSQPEGADDAAGVTPTPDGMTPGYFYDTPDPETLALVNGNPSFRKNYKVSGFDILCLILTPMKLCFTNY